MNEDFKPHIGKTVIETLTMGMYEDPRIIYREYIQNAADQIDIATERKILKKKSDGKILIKINPSKKFIEIADNATGIPADDVLKFLGDVANSEKDQNERKGFRGIGRLGGLGYCDKLTFITSNKGEDVQSIMTLDAKLLKRMLLNRKKTMDAATVISLITNVTEKKEAADKHYFIVRMENVTSPALLDRSKVTDYLTMVAPVPFNSAFTYSSEIKKFYLKHNLVFDEYNIEINDISLFKKYQNGINENETTSTILGIEYFEVRGTGSKLLALGWFGYRDLSNVVLADNVVEKGIRLRKNNIQIGNEFTLNRFFAIARTNQRFIGELHVIGAGFIPNARRDYFIDNSTCTQFEKNLTESLKKGNYENIIAQTASKITNRVADVEKYNKERSEFSTKTFRSQAEESSLKEKLNASHEKAKKAAQELSKLKEKAKKERPIGNLYRKLTANKTLDVIPGLDLTKNIYDPPTFKKLSEPEAKVVRIILSIIEKELDVEDSENLKKKIIDRFN
jgi:hypothetical protein